MRFLHLSRMFCADLGAGSCTFRSCRPELITPNLPKGAVPPGETTTRTFDTGSGNVKKFKMTDRTFVIRCRARGDHVILRVGAAESPK